jgi:SAM-dependent methyltransferase
MSARETRAGTRANVDHRTVEGFGDEWSRFDQTAVDPAELERTFEEYFRVFPWDALPPGAVGADFGCGSGRWARRVAPRVGHLHCIDASGEALAVARSTLRDNPNCTLHHATLDAIPLEDASLDFGFSLGVLHHVPDTARALRSCVRKLKAGAPFLVYLYYALDTRPPWFRAIWRFSDSARRVISHLPMPLRYAVSQSLALSVYWPLARTAAVAESLGADVSSFPLSYYRARPLYTMRNDALDRFGTRLEQRFSRAQIRTMMEHAGLRGVTFSEETPFWCAVGFRADASHP